MSLTVSAGNSGSFELVPEGVYTGRCYRLIDLGTQTTNGQYGTKSQKKVSISWELLDDDVKMQDGRPFSIHKKYTASLHEKADLRKDLEAWRGQKFTEAELEAFDLQNILGTYCAIQVLHSTDGQYANVNTIMKTKEKPTPVNENLFYDLDNPDHDVFDKLSDKMKETIKASPEWGANDAFQAAEDNGDNPMKPDEMPADFLK